jgi:hypothetical protein
MLASNLLRVSVVLIIVGMCMGVAVRSNRLPQRRTAASVR